MDNRNQQCGRKRPRSDHESDGNDEDGFPSEAEVAPSLAINAALNAHLDSTRGELFVVSSLDIHLFFLFADVLSVFSWAFGTGVRQLAT